MSVDRFLRSKGSASGAVNVEDTPAWSCESDEAAPPPPPKKSRKHTGVDGSVDEQPKSQPADKAMPRPRPQPAEKENA